MMAVPRFMLRRYLADAIMLALAVAFGMWVGQAWAIHTVGPGTNPTAPPAAPFVSPTFNLDEATVTQILMRQPAPVLKFWYERAMPHPCAISRTAPVATVGLITGGPGPSALPVQISGCVVETAVKVQIRVDDLLPYYDVVPTLTMVGHAKVWKWPIPAALQDGRTHKVYARAIRASGTVIGPLDNAKAAAQWPFTIGAGTPVPVPVPVPAPLPPPPGLWGTAVYNVATATLVGTANAPVTSIEIFVSVCASTSSFGTVPVVNGAWSWPVPASLKTGKPCRAAAQGWHRDAGGSIIVDGSLPPVPFTATAAPVATPDLLKMPPK